MSADAIGCMYLNSLVGEPMSTPGFGLTMDAVESRRHEAKYDEETVGGMPLYSWIMVIAIFSALIFLS